MVKFSVTLGTSDTDKLDKYAKAEDVERDEAASNLILDGLEDRGY